MTRSQAIKVMVALLALTAAAGALVLLSGNRPASGRSSETFPTIRLGLTAEARQSLQQGGPAFPAVAAGFSAYYRLADGGGGFALDKEAVDRALFDDSTRTLHLAGAGSLLDLGANYTVGSLPITNIGGQISPVNIYYDNEGWIVAYLSRGSESSRVWQAEGVNSENPDLSEDDLSRTTLLDAINETLNSVRADTITREELQYYHWEYPEATSFLMFAIALGNRGTKVASFAIPDSFIVQEASVTQWSTQETMGTPCNAETLIDGELIFPTCGQEILHQFLELNSSAHNVKLRLNGDLDNGAAGTAIMLIYSTP